MTKETAEGATPTAKPEPTSPAKRAAAVSPERPKKGGSYVRQPDGRLSRKDA